MNEYDLFDQVVEHLASVPIHHKGVIRREALSTSYKDSYAVEDAWWLRLRAHGIDESSATRDVCAAIVADLHTPARTAERPPRQIEPAAWERIAESYRTWATIFGNLQLFRQLRHKRDD